MIHVLFVDDDVALLEDLRHLLVMAGAGWEIELAFSGEHALEMIETTAFDVVVADMKMPGIDGAELLAILRDSYPETIRVLMSGNTDLTFTSRLIPQAHQILHKPCKPREVQEVVQRAAELGRRLFDPELHRVLDEVTELPRPPQSVLRLNALMDSADTDVSDVVEVVEGDMALTAKLFQLVNSASYGLSRNMQEVREAVSYLGLNTVRNLAVSVEVFRAVPATTPELSAMVQGIHDHATNVASIARQLVLVRDQANEAFVAGLLHDVGLLAVAAYLPDRFTELHEASVRSGLPIWDMEVDLVGATHADLGAYLLNLWGLPYSIVEAVARHHDAMALPRRRMDPTHAVCIADAIVSSNDTTFPVNEASPEAGLDSAYLGELGVLERVAGLLSVNSEA